MNGKVEFVTVGNGKAIHKAQYFSEKLVTVCGAEKCSTGHRRFGRVRIVKATEPTCKKCSQ
jgi:hypothetical protein